MGYIEETNKRLVTRLVTMAKNTVFSMYISGLQNLWWEFDSLIPCKTSKPEFSGFEVFCLLFLVLLQNKTEKYVIIYMCFYHFF